MKLLICLRRFYWRRIRRWESEICSECGRPVRIVWWCHDDWLWERVTGNHRRPGSKEAAAGCWCIYCFDEAAFAVTGWLEWAPVNLRHLISDEAWEATFRARQKA